MSDSVTDTNVKSLDVAPNTGLLSWVSTIDHKRIGILYILTATIFLGVGGLEEIGRAHV